ncbi:MAG: leucyl aminopeptidase [Rhodobacteraceae bacterium]|nr:leucyl aminopeptidase [Paracoccaceae bacterium]
MTLPQEITFAEIDTDILVTASGRLAVLVPADGKLDPAARRIDRATRGALARFVGSARFADMAAGAVADLAFPSGLAAESLLVVKLDRKCGALAARRAGAAIAAVAPEGEILALAGTHPQAAELALGLALRRYAFSEHRTGKRPAPAPVKVLVAKPEAAAAAAADLAARVEGVVLTRDLVFAPSNVLTTTEFVRRLQELADLGVEVEVLDEDALAKLGMRTLLAVGQGSSSPSRVVVMHWQGGGTEPPVALVGKGVVFDAGGISLKPADGMELMTSDMGGAGVVAGVMRTLARRGATANVVGLVGLVENMPDGAAMRPGDVVATMKGDTVEIINTDAEGRLVLADVLWYAQERFAPRAMVDLATLTGAAVVALGSQKAAVFGNDDPLTEGFLAAAAAEGEGAWRMPLDPAYDKQLKSEVADMKNVGGRPAGAITAAQFLQRFVKDGTPWIHLDIAGVARTPAATDFAPKGATGWGVLSLDRLIRDRFES